jgi:signal transduction histidine kinase
MAPQRRCDATSHPESVSRTESHRPPSKLLRAQDEERRRISRDLQDNASQSSSAIKTDLPPFFLSKGKVCLEHSERSLHPRQSQFVGGVPC